MELWLRSLTRLYADCKKSRAETILHLRCYNQARLAAGLESCETLSQLRALLDAPVLGAVVFCHTTGDVVAMMHMRQASTWPVLSFECYQSSMTGGLAIQCRSVQEGVAEVMVQSLLTQAEYEYLWSTDEYGRQPFVLECTVYGRSLIKVVDRAAECSLKELWEKVRAM